jgi:protein O-mannosyl-transferase
MNQAAQKQLLKYIVCVLLAGVTFAAFASITNHAFISFDDRDYIVTNAHIQQGFSWDSIKWAFQTFHSNNWHPLTWLSHMLDCRLYSLDPAGHHLTNLAFHIANTLLLFLLLYNLTARLWPAAFVALLFAIHPMHVESVAWAAERKDVLSTFFLLLTLLAYARYVELSRTRTQLSLMIYRLALLFFALGLMAKPMLVTLPGILCLLDYWPLCRFQLPLKTQPKSLLHRLILEKIPFILLAALSCCITFIAQNATGAVKPQAEFSVAQRLAHVPVSYAWYNFKCFWPANLSFFYPLRIDYPILNVALALLLLLVVSATACLWARKYPWFVVGWLWFIGTLVPVIGLVQVGNQAYADRYTYLPYVGLFIIIAWGIPELLAGWPHRQAILWGGTTVVAAVCFWRTIDEVRFWKNGQTLYERAIQLDPNNALVWVALGRDYSYQGNRDKAIDCMRHAMTIDNQFNWAWHDLAALLAVKGDYPEAINAYQMALSIANNQRDQIDINNELGNVHFASGRYVEAITNFQSSLTLSPDQPDIQDKLGQCFLQNQQPGQAFTAFQNAVSLDPNNADAQLKLAMILDGEGDGAEAIPHYRMAIALNTNSVIALNNLAWLFATNPDPHLRNGQEAVSLGERACQLTQYQEAVFIGTLAAAYAEAGRFNDAIVTAQKAHDLALAHGQKEIADRNTYLMQLYKSGRAFHLEAKTPSQKP